MIISYLFKGQGNSYDAFEWNTFDRCFDQVNFNFQQKQRS